MSIPLEGLRTVIYPAPDLDSAKQWWTTLLGIDPYFESLFVLRNRLSEILARHFGETASAKVERPGPVGEWSPHSRSSSRPTP